MAKKKKNGKSCSASPYGKEGKGGPLEGCLQEPRSTPQRVEPGSTPIPLPPFSSFTVSVLLWDRNPQSYLRQLRPEERVPAPRGWGLRGRTEIGREIPMISG